MTTPRDEKPPASLADLADRLERLQDRRDALEIRQRTLRIALERAVDRADRVSDQIDAVRLKTIHAVLDRSDVELDDAVRWHYRNDPVAVVHEPDRTFVLAKMVCDEDSCDLPDSREMLARRVALVIIPGPESDASRA